MGKNERHVKLKLSEVVTYNIDFFWISPNCTRRSGVMFAECKDAECRDILWNEHNDLIKNLIESLIVKDSGGVTISEKSHLQNIPSDNQKALMDYRVQFGSLGLLMAKA